MEQIRLLYPCLPLAELLRRSKGLVEIDPPPDTQDAALTYTCCIDSKR